jgi:hypothetical protein
VRTAIAATKNSTGSAMLLQCYGVFLAESLG